MEEILNAKVCLLLVILAFTIGLLNCQTWIRSYDWIDVFPGQINHADAQVCNVIPAIGGGYLLQGWAEFVSGDVEVFTASIFWRIDENGDVIWRRTGLAGWGRGTYSLVSNGVDRYYCVNSYQGSSYLEVYDAELNHLNHYWFQDVNGFDVQINDMKYVEDGLVFGGLVNGQGAIFKTDLAFQLLWQSDAFPTSYHPCEAVEPYLDGWIGITQLGFAQFSATGDSLWTYVNHNDFYSFFDCLVTSDNQIISIGYIDSYALYRIDCVNESVSVIASGLPYGGGYFENISVKQNIDGSFVILMMSENNTILHAYSQVGELLWSRSFFSDSSIYNGSGSNNLLVTASGNILFCTDNNNGLLYLIKTDSNGVNIQEDNQNNASDDAYL
jgi:hypothetical protein